MLPNRILTQTIYYPSDWDNLKKNIQEGWNKDYFITCIHYGACSWKLIMSKVEGWNGQYYFWSKEFPRAKLEKYREEGKYLTSIAHDGTGWVCVVTGVDNCCTQGYWDGKWNECAEKTKEMWKHEAIITNIACDGSTYVFVYTLFKKKVLPPGCLALFMKPTYEKRSFSQGYRVLNKPIGTREIERCCNDNQVVIDLYDMTNDLVVITAGGLEYAKQRIHKAKSFRDLDKIIDNRWAEGYNITSICYFNNEWIVVFSK